MIAELLALLVCAIVGIALVRRVAGEALLVGIGAGAGVLFVLSLIGVPWTRASFVLGMLAIAGLSAIGSRLSGGDLRAES